MLYLLLMVATIIIVGSVCYFLYSLLKVITDIAYSIDYLTDDSKLSDISDTLSDLTYFVGEMLE